MRAGTGPRRTTACEAAGGAVGGAAEARTVCIEGTLVGGVRHVSSGVARSGAPPYSDALLRNLPLRGSTETGPSTGRAGRSGPTSIGVRVAGWENGRWAGWIFAR